MFFETRALRFGAVASASEAMVQEPQRTGNLESRCRRVNKIGKLVQADKLTEPGMYIGLLI